MVKVMVLIVILLLSVAGCAVTPASTPLSGPTPGRASPEPPAPAWKIDWDRTVAAAQQEGELMLYTSIASGPRMALAEAFKGAYGLKPEYVTGRTEEIDVKLQMERRAGLYLADVFIVGSGTSIEYRNQGVIDPLRPLLVLPEVVDPKLWYGGNHIYLDKEGKNIFVWNYGPNANIVLNSDLVKPGEVTKHADLLNPKWKGKIILNDPTTSGQGQKWYQMAVKYLGADFMRQFGRQEPLVTRDLRLQMEWVARGKYPIAVAPKPSEVADFLNAGAPLNQLLTSDLAYASTANPISLANKTTHPNAAKVFINWFLTKDAQTIASKAWMLQSARLDVPTDFLDPVTVRQPGVVFNFSDSEDISAARPAAGKEAATIFGPGAR